MRTQRNPNFRKPADYKIKPIVFLVVTHLPDYNWEYHENRLKVVKSCLYTMREKANHEHTFMIWDNDSGDGFRDWLQEVFQPDILILSPNLGKGAARALAIHMLPVESIVCYSDDDMYFFNDWLRPHLELLNHFPSVAVVSGYPIRTQFRHGIENTLAWARKNADVVTGRLLPDEWEREHASSVGRGWKKYQILTKDDLDYRIIYKGKQAFAQAHHCQFAGVVDSVVKVIDVAIEGAMPDEWPLDIAFDEIGLRLCTTERLCRHIGNVMDEGLDV